MPSLLPFFCQYSDSHIKESYILFPYKKVCYIEDTLLIGSMPSLLPFFVNNPSLNTQSCIRYLFVVSAFCAVLVVWQGKAAVDK
jgi:hypothetical protein